MDFLYVTIDIPIIVPKIQEYKKIKIVSWYENIVEITPSNHLSPDPKPWTPLAKKYKDEVKNINNHPKENKKSLSKKSL